MDVGLSKNNYNSQMRMSLEEIHTLLKYHNLKNQLHNTMLHCLIQNVNKNAVNISFHFQQDATYERTKLNIIL